MFEDLFGQPGGQRSVLSAFLFHHRRQLGPSLPDGRLHCPACTNRIIAGLICSVCYQRITRADQKKREIVIRKGRVRHRRCAG